MIFNPDKVSSIIDRKKPCSSCNFVECFFKDFPILDIIIPEYAKCFNELPGIDEVIKEELAIWKSY